MSRKITVRPILFGGGVLEGFVNHLRSTACCSELDHGNSGKIDLKPLAARIYLREFYRAAELAAASRTKRRDRFFDGRMPEKVTNPSILPFRI